MSQGDLLGTLDISAEATSHNHTGPDNAAQSHVNKLGRLLQCGLSQPVLWRSQRMTGKDGGGGRREPEVMKVTVVATRTSNADDG